MKQRGISETPRLSCNSVPLVDPRRGLHVQYGPPYPTEVEHPQGGQSGLLLVGQFLTELQPMVPGRESLLDVVRRYVDPRPVSYSDRPCRSSATEGATGPSGDPPRRRRT